jgi:CheY-like chemotaxis protein
MASNCPGIGMTTVHERTRILVVDDCRDFTDLLRFGLELAGYDTRTAGSAGEALAGTTEFLPHLVCTDIGMPGMSGIELANRLRRSGHADGMKWIAITGWVDVKTTEDVMAAGFDLCLAKPVDLVSLMAHIEHLLAR